MPCLDSDVLVAFLRRDADAVAFLSFLEKEGKPLSTTVISACELFEGAFLSSKPIDSVNAVQGFLNRFNVLPLSTEASKNFGQVMSGLKKAGAALPEFDVLIACIAMQHGETLVTRNVKHFKRVSGLKVEAW